MEGSIPGDASDVAAIEARLGVLLPPSCNAMVRLFGTVTFEGLEIYGLTKPSGLDWSGIPNVVFATEDSRRKGIVDHGMIEFMTTGHGPFLMLDCNDADNLVSPVFEPLDLW